MGFDFSQLLIFEIEQKSLRKSRLILSWFNNNSYDMEKTDGFTNDCPVLKGPAYETDLKDVNDRHLMLYYST